MKAYYFYACLTLLGCLLFFSQTIAGAFDISTTSIALIVFCVSFILSLSTMKRTVNQEDIQEEMTNMSRYRHLQSLGQSLLEELKMVQIVGDPLSITHAIIHNKKALFDFLAMQGSTHQRIPNFAFFEATLLHKMCKKDFKEILDIFNISLYKEKSRKEFKKSLEVLACAKANFGLLVLEKESGEILNIILINDEIDGYHLSLEIRDRFKDKQGYPQARLLGKKCLYLLYDHFMSAYSKNSTHISLHIGSISAFDKLIREKLNQGDIEQVIFGYCNIFDVFIQGDEQEQRDEALRALNEYFDDEILAIALDYNEDYPYSALVKDKGTTLQVLFFKEDYDNDGQEYDDNYFFDPYLALLDKLGETEELIEKDFYGIHLVSLHADSKVDDTGEHDSQNPADNVIRIETLDGSDECIEIIFPRETNTDKEDTIKKGSKAKEGLDSKESAYDMLFRAILLSN